MCLNTGCPEAIAVILSSGFVSNLLLYLLISIVDKLGNLSSQYYKNFFPNDNELKKKKKKGQPEALWQCLSETGEILVLIR